MKGLQFTLLRHIQFLTRKAQTFAILEAKPSAELSGSQRYLALVFQSAHFNRLGSLLGETLGLQLRFNQEGGLSALRFQNSLGDLF